MTGEDVKRQVMDIPEYWENLSLDTYLGAEIEDRIRALAPCIVLTPEEAEVVREALGDPIDALILLTPEEAPPVADEEPAAHEGTEGRDSQRPAGACDVTGKDVKRQVEETHAAVGEALTITRGGTVQMPKAHWDRIITAGLNLKPALAPCVVLTAEEVASVLAVVRSDDETEYDAVCALLTPEAGDE